MKRFILPILLIALLLLVGCDQDMRNGLAGFLGTFGGNAFTSPDPFDSDGLFKDDGTVDKNYLDQMLKSGERKSEVIEHLKTETTGDQTDELIEDLKDLLGEVLGEGAPNLPDVLGEFFDELRGLIDDEDNDVNLTQGDVVMLNLLNDLIQDVKEDLGDLENIDPENLRPYFDDVLFMLDVADTISSTFLLIPTGLIDFEELLNSFSGGN